MSLQEMLYHQEKLHPALIGGVMDLQARPKA